MLLGMGFIGGVFAGALVVGTYTAAVTDTRIAEQAQENMRAEKAAPGAVEGGVVGALAIPYLFIFHNSLMAALRETRRQTAQTPPAP